MRLLLIEDDARFSAVIQHHLSCRWPEVALEIFSPAVHGEVPAEFLAQGFDAVLLSSQGAPGSAAQRLQALVNRPGFAPVVYFDALGADGSAQSTTDSAAHAVLNRDKIDHQSLLDAVTSAVAKQELIQADWRTSLEGINAQKFSNVLIPGYRCIKRLAGGVFADLYLAESIAAGTLVVLKLAHDSQKEADTEQSFQRFLQEYSIVDRIRHPSIVRLYDLGVSDAHAYLVMEYFRDGDLRKRMRSGVTPREALRYSISIAHALEAIHAAGILHRDLKPGNIMQRNDGSLALIDFGLSKDVALNREITDHGMIFGTPHYMSPEQGHAEPIDTRSDLYSLGIILFEMLTGEKPYTADNPMAIIYKHRKLPIPQLPNSLAMLQPLVAGLLAKKPEERFPTAAAAVVVLEATAARF
jgi:eukaryotic-like serine/threonine-protein kinase